MKKGLAILLVVTMLFQITACSSSSDNTRYNADDRTYDNPIDEISKNVKDVMDNTKEELGQTKEELNQIKEEMTSLYKQINYDVFVQGWNQAVDLMSSTYAATLGSEYVKEVGNAIDTMRKDINVAEGSKRTIASEAGYAAEKWTADTFNIDAVAGGSAYRAEVVGSTEMGSVDVSTNYGEKASLKYYNNSNGSASAQATNILQEYKAYAAKSKNPMSLEEYLNRYNVDGNDIDALYASIYEGQTRIIPADQIDEATDFLKSKCKTFDDYAEKNGSENAKARSKGYKETLNNLKDKLEAPDGTKSKSATYDEMQAIAELAQNGEFDPAEFGITTSQIITPKYLVKESIKSGLTSAALNAAITIGPDLYSILKEAAQNGNIDEEQLKKIGVEGLISGSEGFIEGSVSCAILIACQSGKLGSELTNASPDVIGTLTVLTIDAIRYGYSLSKGEITPEDYSNLMIEEIVVAIVSIGTGAAFKMLLPAVPFAYMAGCMAGSMLAAIGLQAAKEIIMEVKDGGGFEAIVPVDRVNALTVISDKIAELNIMEQISDFKDIIISTAKNGYITVRTTTE